MHGTSRLWKPSPETEEERTRRESQRQSRRESQRRLDRLKHAGMHTQRQDTRPQSVKKFPGSGDASLRTFGSTKWAAEATRSLPRYATTNMASFGVVAVPDWSRDVGVSELHRDGLSLDVHPKGNAVWLGTRYATEHMGRRGWSAPRARIPDQNDPRIKNWRGVKSAASLADVAREAAGNFLPFDDRLHGVVPQRTIRPSSASSAAPTESNEVAELRSMGIGAARLDPTPRASTPPQPASEMAKAVSEAAEDDLSWVTHGPWVQAARLAMKAAKLRSPQPPQSRTNPVPSLSFDFLAPNSKESVAARLKAPIGPSG